MKCEKIVSSIYLYNELDEQERHQVDIHIDGCSSCKILFTQTSNQQLLIRKAGETPILAASPERIKRNIMQAIVGTKRNWFDEIILIVNQYLLRASLVVASILLTAFFFSELSADYTRTPLNSTYTASSGIRLNTPKFLKDHIKRREATNQVSFYDCLKQSDCDFLKNLKTNKNL